MRLAHAAVATAVVLALVSAGLYGLRQRNDMRQNQIDRDLAVATLPEGVEEAWFAYADERVRKMVQRVGKVLRVNDPFDDSGAAVMFLSENTPFSVACDITNPSVSFAVPGDELLQGLFVFGFEDVPPLPVDRRSIAAERLAAKLCERIAADLQSITVGQQ